MSSVELIPMPEEHYRNFISRTKTEFAQDSVQAGRMPEDSSIAIVEKMLGQLLPQGLYTPDHYFRTVIAKGKPVGGIWYASRGDRLFIYDIWLDPESRGRGYGTEALKQLEKEALKLNHTGIGLHVFGHNTGAARLYRKCGYIVTGMEMEKRL